jgi:hypothetical protein
MVDVLLLAGTGLRFTCWVPEAVPHFMQQLVWEALRKVRKSQVEVIWLF